ncbi:MAG: class I SAM-dependent methyltransferase [Tetrasphaera sp.]|nr:class I SAM-dependent methyltransferase [Tetrasphaera sp.]
MTSDALGTPFRVPHVLLSRPRALIARALVQQVVGTLPVRLRFPDGTITGGGGPHSPTFEVLREDELFARIGDHPKIGLGEAYMAGLWRAGQDTDLADLLAPFAQRLGNILPRPLMRLRALVDEALPDRHRNTVHGARRNIEAHYDLSNDLFAAFLDPSMTYSSALFDPSAPREHQDLHRAQLRKIDAILDRAGVTEGTRLLEIGSGWGELALRAAGRGATVTTITLSAEQQALARQKLAAAGVADRVEVRLQDYRDVRGEFDAVVSVEMIEAVGEEFWPTYFAAIDDRLAPGGSAVVQSILMDHDRYLMTRNSHGWIQKYIFPGGLIPSLTAIREVTAAHTQLRVTQVRSFGMDYAETLRRWRATFLESWPMIAGERFDETFRRMWEFYLAYCEAGFATGYLDVAQITLRRSAEIGP